MSLKPMSDSESWDLAVKRPNPHQRRKSQNCPPPFGNLWIRHCRPADSNSVLHFMHYHDLSLLEIVEAFTLPVTYHKGSDWKSNWIVPTRWS